MESIPLIAVFDEVVREPFRDEGRLSRLYAVAVIGDDHGGFRLDAHHTRRLLLA